MSSSEKGKENNYTNGIHHSITCGPRNEQLIKQNNVSSFAHFSSLFSVPFHHHFPVNFCVFIVSEAGSDEKSNQSFFKIQKH